MPRYSFTLRDGVSVRDAGAEELPHHEAACDVAREIALAFAKNPIATRFRVVFENEIGKIICDLPFGNPSKADAS